MLETKVNIEDVKFVGIFCCCVPSMLLFCISAYALTKLIQILTSLDYLLSTAKRRQCQIPSRKMLYFHAPCHPPPWVQTKRILNSGYWSGRISFNKCSSLSGRGHWLTKQAWWSRVYSNTQQFSRGGYATGKVSGTCYLQSKITIVHIKCTILLSLFIPE